MKELAKKLVAAMMEIDAVEKRGRNEKQGYSYVKAVDVAKEVRAVLVEHGIAFTFSTGETERWEKQTNAGGTLFFVQLKISVTFTDMDTGDSKTVGGIGWGMDSGDKAIYKAMTGALKYAMRMNFLIPDELDPEEDGRASEKPLMTSDSHGNMQPVQPRAAAPNPVQPIAPRPATTAPGKESIFIESIDKRQSSKGDPFLVITSSNRERYSVWDKTFFDAAFANVGRTLTLGVKVDAKGYKSIISGLEPIEMEG